MYFFILNIILNLNIIHVYNVCFKSFISSITDNPTQIYTGRANIQGDLH